MKSYDSAQQPEWEACYCKWGSYGKSRTKERRLGDIQAADDGRRKGPDWERQKKIKPQKVHKEKSLSWLSVSQETEKKVIEAACNVQEHRQNQRPTLTRRLAVMGSRMRATWTMSLQSWVMHHTWQQYLMLSLSTVSLFNIKGKEVKSSRDILNIEVIQMTPWTWDHSHKHFRKGCLNALCIFYFFISWHLHGGLGKMEKLI